MIEEALVNYGVLGVWTCSLLVERWAYNKYMSRLITANVVILNKLDQKIKEK